MSNYNWFKSARYGMFIHWGPYSVAGRGEWVLNREYIPYKEYIEKHVNHFTAEQYNPKEWAKLARKSGMKYMVLTTRHHDGFALWDTATNDFNAVKMGPKKDLVKMFVDSVREQGLKVGLYYSVADWHHPDYPGAYCRDWPQEWSDERARKRFVQYYYTQLEELMTLYGEIDLLWYDGCLPKPLDGEAINQRIKQLQPNILINNRNGKPYDFMCSEQTIDPAPVGVLWEACMTLNNNWGYHVGDKNYKGASELIRMILEVAANEGNLLLNVSPKGDGQIPEESIKILNEVGEWLCKNGEGIYGSERSPFSWNNSGKLIIKGNKVYLYMYYFVGTEFCLAEIKNKVKSITLLETGQPIDFENNGDRLILKNLKKEWFQSLVTTIVIEVEGTPQPLKEQANYWIV